MASRRRVWVPASAIDSATALTGEAFADPKRAESTDGRRAGQTLRACLKPSALEGQIRSPKGWRWRSSRGVARRIVSCRGDGLSRWPQSRPPASPRPPPSLPRPVDQRTGVMPSVADALDAGWRAGAYAVGYGPAAHARVAPVARSPQRCGGTPRTWPGAPPAAAPVWATVPSDMRVALEISGAGSRLGSIQHPKPLASSRKSLADRGAAHAKHYGDLIGLEPGHVIQIQYFSIGG